MDKIAVVILNWNGCDMLRSFLPSVVRFSEVDGAVVYVDGELLGYYEKHEFRNKETAKMYDFEQSLV